MEALLMSEVVSDIYLSTIFRYLHFTGVFPFPLLLLLYYKSMEKFIYIFFTAFVSSYFLQVKTLMENYSKPMNADVSLWINPLSLHEVVKIK